MCHQKWCLHFSIFCSCSIQSGKFFPLRPLPDSVGTFWGPCHLLLLISGGGICPLLTVGGEGGTDSVVLGCSLPGGLHWSHSLVLHLCSSLLLNSCWFSLIPRLPWVVICDPRLVFPEVWITRCWVTPSWVLKLVGMITGGCTLSPSHEILESWIGSSWCRLDSNGHSSDTPTGAMSGECNGYCWCGLDSNWCPPPELLHLQHSDQKHLICVCNMAGGLLAALYIFCKIKWPSLSSMKRSVWSGRRQRGWGFLHSFPAEGRNHNGSVCW